VRLTADVLQLYLQSVTLSVPGQMTFTDAPWGTQCSDIWFVLLNHPDIVNLSHNGNASVSVIAKCVVLVKICGNRPGSY
jgi:hypothetical protein